MQSAYIICFPQLSLHAVRRDLSTAKYFWSETKHTNTVFKREVQTTSINLSLKFSVFTVASASSRVKGLNILT